MTASPSLTGEPMPLPLQGHSVLVTRARHQAGRLTAELQALGASVIEIPTLEIAPPASYEPLDQALGQLQRYDWLIITSTNTVQVLRERMAVLGLTRASFAHLEIAAVGSATAESLREIGFRVSFMPKEYVAESLIDALGDQIRGQSVLLVRAAIARDLIPDAFRERGAEISVVDAYTTIVPRSSVERIQELFAAKEDLPGAATFTSSSSVTNFFALLSEAGIRRQPPAMKAISIGPVTSQTLRSYQWEPAAEADPHTIAGLVAAVKKGLANRE
ncbi:uroporphyrinogen-III synthase [Paracidobacterium acidisoli]|uniref:Uroporphyrinogen-III synthase n=1 Tax=Paracidobacterium acidisoli TaxID=2303751 RepID=A0A372IQW4_9BACT|nr:uroporphyrinogen-III synthase [Paracidobacterium acidisoli]MBT9330159.1 uroporphyrinogen-III synthase [Paracidobacterium acidisoli]